MFPNREDDEYCAPGMMCTPGRRYVSRTQHVPADPVGRWIGRTMIALGMLAAGVAVGVGDILTWGGLGLILAAFGWLLSRNARPYREHYVDRVPITGVNQDRELPPAASYGDVPVRAPAQSREVSHTTARRAQPMADVPRIPAEVGKPSGRGGVGQPLRGQPVPLETYVDDDGIHRWRLK